MSNAEQLANVLETVAQEEHQRGLLMGAAVAAIGFGLYQHFQNQKQSTAKHVQTDSNSVSTQNGVTRYNPYSGVYY